MDGPTAEVTEECRRNIIGGHREHKHHCDHKEEMPQDYLSEAAFRNERNSWVRHKWKKVCIVSEGLS